MSVLIIGADGSMGKRYQAILKYRSIPFSTADIMTDDEEMEALLKDAKGVIIATPTETHFDYMTLALPYKVPVLCEKPLSKDPKQLELIKELCHEGLNLTMMMQYKFLDDPTSSGPSFYNYFRHGNDGLKWDCLQIIGLARSSVMLGEDNVIWTCRLNGKQLSLADMDWAYLKAVDSWMHSPGHQIDWLLDIHQKTLEF